MFNTVNTDQLDHEQRKKYKANCYERGKNCQYLIPAARKILNTLISLSCRINKSMKSAQEIKVIFRIGVKH